MQQYFTKTVSALSLLSTISGKPAVIVVDNDINTDFDTAGFNEVFYNVTRAVPLLTSAPSNTLYPTWFFEQEGYQTYSIQSWGCWCHFEQHVLQGHGVVMNEVDQLCKNMALAYRCSILDSETESASCVPWDQDFVPFMNPFSETTDIISACYERNPSSDCAARNCVVQAEFVVGLATLVATTNDKQVLFDSSLEQSNGFDRSVCKTFTDHNTDIIVSGQPECCGAYPNRIPFHATEGKMCCNGLVKHTEVCDIL